jgi:hypothetical protein
MQFFIKLLILETVNNPEVIKLTQAFGEQLKILFSKGKVILSGAFKDAKGGFFVVDIDSVDNLDNFTGSTVLKNMYVEAHPITPFDKIGDLFKALSRKKKQPGGGGISSL